MLDLGHKKMDVWKLGNDFVKVIYGITESFPKTEIYGITNQLRRASVSIVSNIAEGASKSSSTERKRYYSIARSSLVEVDTQLEIAILLGFLPNDKAEALEGRVKPLFAMLTNLIKKTG
jgi:four helix bundle protein